MKNDLTCAVVRDLLPSCVENLAAAETVQAVERHLAACPDCAARHAAMVDPELAAKLEIVKHGSLRIAENSETFS